MTCKQRKKHIPLLAGGDLPERKARRLRRHLKACEACRKELKEYEAILAGIKSFALEEERDWEEEEWQSLLQKVTAEKPGPCVLSLGVQTRTAWAYGFLVLLVLGLTAFLFWTILSHRKTVGVIKNITITQAQPARTFQAGETVVPQIEDAPFVARAPRLRREKLEPTFQAALPEEVSPQERLSLTLISSKSGLRVHWIFDKNFEWKETGR